MERYYRNPLLSGTARGNALPNIIGGLYGEGLAPLADKVGLEDGRVGALARGWLGVRGRGLLWRKVRQWWVLADRGAITLPSSFRVLLSRAI